jgi:hypothetical protein
MWTRADDRRVFTGLLLALIALCWLALSIWSVSPFAPLLSHELLRESHFTDGADYVVVLLVFVMGWTLMTIAMMLPTSLPLITLFQRMTRSRENRARLIALLIAAISLSGFCLARWHTSAICWCMGSSTMLTGSKRIAGSLARPSWPSPGFISSHRSSMRVWTGAVHRSALSLNTGRDAAKRENPSRWGCIMACFAWAAAGR